MHIGAYCIGLCSHCGEDSRIIHNLCEEYGLFPAHEIYLPVKTPLTLGELFSYVVKDSPIGWIAYNLNGYAPNVEILDNSIVVNKNLYKFAQNVKQLNLFAYED